MIKMTEQIVSLLPALIFGFILGLAFFSSLFWTVRKGLNSKTPVLWFLGGFIIRISIALCAFHLLANHNWQLLAISLIGFLIGRFVIHKMVHSQKSSEEAQHAP